MTYSFEDFKKEFLPLKNEKDIFPDGEIKDYFGDVIYHPKSYSYVSQFVYDKVV
jgi:hypothetical protein